MAIEFHRRANSDDIWIRITGDVLVNCSAEQYAQEMEKAVKEFVQNDAEVRILINEMVKTAFSQVDLLKVVTDAIKNSLPTVPIEKEETMSRYTMDQLKHWEKYGASSKEVQEFLVQIKLLDQKIEGIEQKLTTAKETAAAFFAEYQRGGLFDETSLRRWANRFGDIAK